MGALNIKNTAKLGCFYLKCGVFLAVPNYFRTFARAII